jgi:hypothetical protein
MSTETALFQVTHRLEESLNQRVIVLGAFLDIEGAFDNTSFHAIITAARERGLEEPVVGGSGPCLKADLYTLLLGAAV